jgi:hypothetical protein
MWPFHNLAAKRAWRSCIDQNGQQQGQREKVQALAKTVHVAFDAKI